MGVRLSSRPNVEGPGGGGGAGPGADSTPDVQGLERRTEEANQALVRGDIDRYIALTRHAKDYVLMNPFGGAPTRGFDDTPERRAGMKRFFKSGTLKQEVIGTYASPDRVVLVTIERMHGEVGDVPEQDWSLRVTRSSGGQDPDGSWCIGMRTRS